MFSPLRNRFGIPGVISVIALVFAMFGGAYAASDNGGSNDATASAKKKAKKGPRGPKGPAGPAGAQGPAGPQGPAGAQGAKGDKGDKGDTGNSGTNGVSAKTKTFAGSKGSCSEGGIEVESSSPTSLVCNGKKGADGSPWTVGGTLPSGATMTGAWGTSGGAGKESHPDISLTPISFPLRVSPPPTALLGRSFEPPLIWGMELKDGEVGFYGTTKPEPESQEEAEEMDQAYKEACPGTADEPKAAPGFLCIYRKSSQGTFQEPFPFSALANTVEAANEYGLVVPYQVGDNTSIRGSWAVTAK